jgi:16S rRNA (cytidine1402-2'-O)-methyltransferase
VAQLLADLAGVCGDRPVAVCRELTKLHEEVWRGSLAESAQEFADREVLGEVVIVLAGAEPTAAPGDEAIASAVAERLAAGDSPRRAADAVAAALGVARRRAYTLAIERRDAG